MMKGELTVRVARTGEIGPLEWSALVALCTEAVATLPEAQGNGYATALLRRTGTMLDAFDLALLSPSEEAFYARLGWATWQGPLSVRERDGTITPTPDEEIMWLRLPRTPVAVDAHAAIETDWRPCEAW